MLGKVDSIVQLVVAGITVVVALIVLVLAFKSGVLRRIRFGGLEVEASPREKAEAKALIQLVSSPSKDAVPFETEQLAQYYAQVLAQSRISFWFSLIFASLGFVVIVIAVFSGTGSTSTTTFAQIAAGVIMDAVASLFFVQSKSAQKSMGEFFDKLRRDRQQAESRALCDSIQNPDARDALRVQLALFYAGVEQSSQVATSILGSLAPRTALPPAKDGAAMPSAGPATAAVKAHETTT